MLFLIALALVGCQDNRPVGAFSKSLAEPQLGSTTLPSLDAQATPPRGWRAEPVKSSAKHQHQVWLSPSGQTAYGIIYFAMPIPVSADFVLPFFIAQMRKSLGEANLMAKDDDPSLPGVHFQAEGGPYRMSVDLLTSGLHGWAIYSGTLRNQPINSTELDLANKARQNTHVGLSAGASEAP